MIQGEERPRLRELRPQAAISPYNCDNYFNTTKITNIIFDFLSLPMLKALHPSYENASYNKITKKHYTKPSIIAIKATKKIKFELHLVSLAKRELYLVNNRNV